MDFDEISSNSQKIDNNPEEGGLDKLLFLEQDFNEQQFLPTKECIVFLIDCHSPIHKIFSNLSIETTALFNILKVTENFLKLKYFQIKMIYLEWHYLILQ